MQNHTRFRSPSAVCLTLITMMISSTCPCHLVCRWVAFRGVLSDGKGRGTVTDLMRRFNKCQTSALIKPGSNSVKASNDIWQNNAMLALYAGDPNSGDGCAFSKRHTDSTMIAIGGMGCGTMGAGQVGSNYVKHHVRDLPP